MAKAWQLPDAYSGTYRLEFADPSFKGLKVVCKRHTLNALTVAAKLLEIDIDALNRGQVNAKDVENLDEALKELAENIVRWNLQIPDGKGGHFTPKPTYHTLAHLDLVFVLQIFVVWLKIIVHMEFANLDPSEIPMETDNG